MTSYKSMTHDQNHILITAFNGTEMAFSAHYTVHYTICDSFPIKPVCSFVSENASYKQALKHVLLCIKTASQRCVCGLEIAPVSLGKIEIACCIKVYVKCFNKDVVVKKKERKKERILRSNDSFGKWLGDRLKLCSALM